jgi:serine/threonine protein phosphatase PrpC
MKKLQIQNRRRSVGADVKAPAKLEIFEPRYIQRNVITKYAFATRVGFIPGNTGKVNQDSYILAPNIEGPNFKHFFGVCDGHGQNGQHASGFIKQKLPEMVKENLIKHKNGIEID